MVTIALPNYTNSLPYSEGLQNPSEFFFDVILDSPSQIYTMLEKKEVSMALVPVAFFLQERQGINILPEFCIGSDNKVESVCLFSHTPIEKVKNIYLDYQSRTSNILLQILLKEFWQIQPTFISKPDDSYIAHIQDDTAGLIIGDRALANKSKYPYCYDLVEAWKKHTGLPFVFAVWGYHSKEISTEQLQHIIHIFRQATQEPLHCLKGKNNSLDLQTYLMENISFKFDELKQKSLDLFLYKTTLHELDF